MPTTITPFLMFTGQAKPAMDFYLATFPGAKIVKLDQYGPGEQCPAGQVRVATIRLHNQEFTVIDSPPVHAFSFTPSISLLVTADSEPEIERLFQVLSAGGQVMMPLDAYPWSKKYAWLTDRFGVSWQLKLA